MTIFIPVVIDYALLKDVAVVALSARGECRAEVCRLVDVGKLATSWFLEVAVGNTDHKVGLFSAVVREYPALFRNVRRFSTVVPALQADFALARNEKNSIIHPIEESMVVATDALLGTGHRAGIAAGSTRGRVRARSLLVESVADAEFWAVEMALATWAKKRRFCTFSPTRRSCTRRSTASRSPLGAGTPCECGQHRGVRTLGAWAPGQRAQ